MSPIYFLDQFHEKNHPYPVESDFNDRDGIPFPLISDFRFIFLAASRQNFVADVPFQAGRWVAASGLAAQPRNLPSCDL